MTDVPVLLGQIGAAWNDAEKQISDLQAQLDASPAAARPLLSVAPGTSPTRADAYATFTAKVPAATGYHGFDGGVPANWGASACGRVPGAARYLTSFNPDRLGSGVAGYAASMPSGLPIRACAHHEPEQKNRDGSLKLPPAAFAQMWLTSSQALLAAGPRDVKVGAIFMAGTLRRDNGVNAWIDALLGLPLRPDFIGFDGYSRDGLNWPTAEKVFSASFDYARERFPHAELIVAEVGVNREVPGGTAAWWSDAWAFFTDQQVSEVAVFPQVGTTGDYTLDAAGYETLQQVAG